MKNEKSEVIQAVEALAHEKDISVDMLYTAIEEAIRVAYKRNLPKDVVPPTSVVARMNRVSGAINVYARMLVVDEVTNPSAQIDLAHAQKIRPSAQVDDIIEQDVTPKGFLRVAALTAKQVIMQRIREAERGKIYDEYVEKTDEILTAVVQRQDDNNVYVELGNTEGILEKREMIPGRVVYFDGRFYLRCMDEQTGEERTYRIDRMRNIRAGGKAGRAAKLSQPDGVQLDMFRPERFASVTLRADRVLLDDMLEHFGKYAGDVQPDSDPQRVRIRVRIGIGPSFYRWVMRYGDQLEVLAPADIRSEMRRYVRQTLALYDDEGGL